MLRTRQINREFWKSEDVAELTHFERLLFIGLWAMSDRAGLLLNKPRKIRAEIFPYDELSANAITGGINRLSELDLIEIRQNGTDVITCIYIHKFLEYQHIHPHEAASKLACNYITGNVIKCKPTSTSTSTSTSASTWDKEQSGKPDDVPIKPNIKEQAQEILDHLNLTTGRKFTMTTKIEACIKREKCTVDQCKIVIDHKAAKWLGTDMADNLNPTTPFRAVHFQAYLDEAQAGQAQSVAAARPIRRDSDGNPMKQWEIEMEAEFDKMQGIEK